MLRSASRDERQCLDVRQQPPHNHAANAFNFSLIFGDLAPAYESTTSIYGAPTAEMSFGRMANEVANPSMSRATSKAET
jgi:hypothetical protein